MKKSEKYKLAMLAVLRDVYINYEDSLEIIEMLIGDKATAEYVEKAEEENNGQSL